jgi:hypothetical protein
MAVAVPALIAKATRLEHPRMRPFFFPDFASPPRPLPPPQTPSMVVKTTAVLGPLVSLPLTSPAMW